MSINLLFGRLVQMIHNRWVNPRTTQAPGAVSVVVKPRRRRQPQRQWPRTSTHPQHHQNTQTNPL